MWGGLVVGLMARPWARRIIGAALAALTVVLFLFNLRRAGERAGRAAERLEALEALTHAQRHMLEKPLGVLAVGMIFLNGCATGSSEWRATGVCPPMVEYSRDEQRRMAEEVEALPENAVIIGWLADYAVLRAQLEYCR